jgi:hypothetical protein
MGALWAGLALTPTPSEVPEGGLRAVVVDSEGEIGDIVTLEGERYNLHRRDVLRMTEADVRRIRWFEDDEGAMITLRLSDGRWDEFDERVRRRASQFDVLLIDGEPVHTILHFGSSDRLILWDRDRSGLRGIYERLTSM